MKNSGYSHDKGNLKMVLTADRDSTVAVGVLAGV